MALKPPNTELKTPKPLYYQYVKRSLEVVLVRCTYNNNAQDKKRRQRKRVFSYYCLNIVVSGSSKTAKKYEYIQDIKVCKQSQLRSKVAKR